MKEALINMDKWIFKAIYYPITILLALMFFAILGYMAKEVNWETPLRWILIINLVAFVADYFVNK